MGARGLDFGPGTFYAAILRLALLLLPERGRAMARIPRALQARKEVAALGLATADECPYVALPMGIAGRYGGNAQAAFGDPGMFALGDPAVLAAAYRDAGFREVNVEAARVQRRFSSFAAAMQNLRDVLPEIP